MKLLVKPKGKKKKIIEVPDDEVPVRPKGWEKKSKIEGQNSDNEMKVKFRDNEEKFDASKATDNETEKKK